MRLSTQAVFFTTPNEQSINNDVFITKLLNSHDERLLKHISITSDEFFQVYAATHVLDNFPPSTNLNPAYAYEATHTQNQDRSTSAISRYFNRPQSQSHSPSGTQPTQHEIEIEARSDALMPSVNHIIESIFVTPYEEYLAQIQKNDAAIRLKKLFITHLDVNATAESQDKVDSEPTVDRALLHQLITKATQAQTVPLLKKVALLKKRLKTALSKKPRGAKFETPQKKKKSPIEKARKKTHVFNIPATPV